VSEKPSRTWLCSVVFVDIAGYTRLPITAQVATKTRLEDHLAEVVADVPAGERIIVDTGDGAAICFLSDPEVAMFAALSLRERTTGQEALALRIGINLGPIKVVKSLNGQINPLGDGINNAQRVMSFAEPNQILVARSFYDVIACLSNEYAQLFHYLGVRTDKHVREHWIYEVVLPGAAETVHTLLTRSLDVPDSEELARRTGWDRLVLAAVTEDLTKHIGPIAQVLVKRAAVHESSVEGLRRRLADAIPDEAQRRAFLQAAPISAAPVPTTRDRRDTNNVASAADTALLSLIETELATHLGPVARALVKRHARLPLDAQSLLQKLAEELPPEQRESFLTAVRERQRLA
jgi:class 3 adenylate cyclase